MVDGISTTGDEAPSVAPWLRDCRGVLLGPNQINGAMRVSQSYVWGKIRFEVASTPQQRQIYSTLYPKLMQLRNEIAPALATSGAPKTNGTEPEDFFSVMSNNGWCPRKNGLT